MKEVEFIQYIHPHRVKEKISVTLPDDIAKLAEDQVLSTECMPNDYSKVILYSYKKGLDINKHPEYEEMLFADNGPGENSPPNVLTKLIKLVAEKYKDK